MNHVKQLFLEKMPSLMDTYWGQILIDRYNRTWTIDADAKKSGNWNMCSCGELVPALLTKKTSWDTYSGGRLLSRVELEPKDDKLRHLGEQFDICIKNAHKNTTRHADDRLEYILEAAQHQINIEKRVAMLLNKKGMVSY